MDLVVVNSRTAFDSAIILLPQALQAGVAWDDHPTSWSPGRGQ
ncbi:hypothetical protein PG5_02880 [Pseudomonas sp. G5(2012)]|nr:hypothetical protein PG5_02880 [Pseudomonas sp. G5(2012)]